MDRHNNTVEFRRRAGKTVGKTAGKPGGKRKNIEINKSAVVAMVFG